MKKLIVLVLIILLTGCSATYNLEIKDNKINEKLLVSFPNDDKGSLDYFNNNTFYAVMNGVSNFKKYNKHVGNDNSKTNVNLSYNYKLREFKKATILKSCFDAYNVLNENKYYTISTTEGLTCATEEDAILLDNLDIIIKTNHIVKDTNADEVDGYIYTWHLNRNNYKTKSIYIKMYKDKFVWNYENEFYKKLALYISVGCAIIGSSLFIIFKFLYNKRKANKI